jgi:hypothetical protein
MTLSLMASDDSGEALATRVVALAAATAACLDSWEVGALAIQVPRQDAAMAATRRVRLVPLACISRGCDA